MNKLIFGILVGAGLMYFFDPRAGRERREMLTERARNSKDTVSDVKGRAEHAATAGRDTAKEARERVKSITNHTQERVAGLATETVQDAKREAEQFAETTADRARAVANSDSTNSA